MYKNHAVNLHNLFQILLHSQVVELLLEHDANVNSVNSHKLIPLHLAAQNGHLNLSKLLIDAGSKVNFADLIGKQSNLNVYFNKVRLLLHKIQFWFQNRPWVNFLFVYFTLDPVYKVKAFYNFVDFRQGRALFFKR